MPTPMRATARAVKLPARPQAAEKMLQMAQAAAMIRTRWLRSASQASGMPKVV